MTEIIEIAATEHVPHEFPLRRAWQCGYDAAARDSELVRWVKDDARLLAWAADYDADIEHPAGWAAWLTGYATGCCEDKAQAVAVLRAAAGKVEELDE